MGVFLKSCRRCIHERQFKGLPVCLKYYAQVRINKTCDDWDGGAPVGHNPEVGLHGAIYFHDDIPDDIEMAVLNSGEITVLDE
jgi:hypothetical protein